MTKWKCLHVVYGSMWYEIMDFKSMFPKQRAEPEEEADKKQDEFI